jgi:hypothetical protein
LRFSLCKLQKNFFFLTLWKNQMPTAGLCKETPRLYFSVALGTLFALMLALFISLAVLWRLDALYDTRCWSFPDSLLLVRTASSSSGGHLDFELLLPEARSPPNALELVQRSNGSVAATLCSGGECAAGARVKCDREFHRHPERFLLRASWPELELAPIGALCRL